jgi:putative molybdopterin biosynthesis protein
MQDIYLNSEEAASYLGIKERKLYELVGAGRIPATKATGKWLFPRAALDRWLEAGLIIPPGFLHRLPPMIIAGSQDPLLDWAARQSGSGLALLAEGSAAGLAHLEKDEAAVAAIHLHQAGADCGDANRQAVSQSAHLVDAVIIRFAEREQGILTRPEQAVSSLSDAVSRGLRFGMRQKGAGAQLLFEQSLAASHIPLDMLTIADTIYPSGEDLAFAIHNGHIDCGLATRAVALKAGLAFTPLLWEAFDLVVRRRVYFEPALQALFGFLRSQDFHAHAQTLGGYRTEKAGQVQLNR